MKFYKKLRFKISAVIVIFLLILTGVFLIYTANYYHAADTAVEAMTQIPGVRILHGENTILFAPETNSRNVGFVFYPGAKVEYSAYSPLMAKLAEEGITCVLVKMPYNLAIFDVNAADQVIREIPDITNWYIGGHSLGGAMASSYAANNAGKLKGIILAGAYPSSDLSKTDLKMLVLYGSNDKVLNRTKLSETKTNAPKDSLYYEIKGGNHACFGNYGIQAGDGSATISADQQQNEATNQIAKLIVGACRKALE